MKRIYSLKGKNLFKQVYRQGVKLQDQGIKIIVLKSSVNFKDKDIQKGSNGNRKIKIGISIKKNFGKAHTRNWARRKIRAILQGLLNEFENDFNMIVIPEENFKNLKHESIRIIIISLLIKAGVIQH